MNKKPANFQSVLQPTHTMPLIYRPDIDGLRAVAILLVIFHHTFPQWLPGGFIGVDVFFVISGYLISSIIFKGLEDSHKSKFTFARFYARRIKRIFPALILVLVASWFMGRYILFTDEFQQLGTHITAASVFLSNFLLWQESGYFDTAAQFKPLLHLWSLGIEEQFYIIWPALLVLTWGKKQSHFLWLVTLIIIISFLINVFNIDRHSVATFYLPFTRFWELLLGGLLAYHQLHKNLKYNLFIKQITSKFHIPLKYGLTINDMKSFLGGILLVISAFGINKYTSYPGWWALLPTVGTFLLIAAGPLTFINFRILSNPLFVYIGLISYPLYLWHWPLLSFLNIYKYGVVPKELKLAAIALAFLLASLTYFWIEKPIRSSKNVKYGWIIVSILTVMLICLGILGFTTTKGYVKPQRITPLVIAQLVKNPKGWEYNGGGFVNGDQLAMAQIQADADKTVLFWGDSHIEMYWPRFKMLLTQKKMLYKNITFFTKGGCLPVPGMDIKEGRCQEYYSKVLDYILQHPEIDTIIIGAYWEGGYFQGGYYAVNSDENKFLTIDSQETNKIFKGFEEMLEGFVKSGKHVYVVLSNPSGDMLDPKYIARNYKPGMPFPSVDRQQVIAKMAPFISKVRQAALRAGAQIIDPIDYLCDNSVCPAMTKDGKPIYMDSHHLSPVYTKDHVFYFDDIIKR